MCGIIGGVGLVTQQEIESLLTSIAHRGPDAQDVQDFNASSVTLGHVRLAIIDLDERSSQPMSSDCGRYHIVFNGEIYNYLALKETLLAKGYQFNTQSDTEVLLNWLIENGADGIDQLDGMFSFCFLDESAQSMLLARDHIGEKPLYYSHAKNNFLFCSEIAPMAQLDWVDKRLNLEALKNYLYFLYTAAPHTLYEGIKELAPGQCLKVDLKSSAIEINHYFSLSERLSSDPKINTAAEDVKTFMDGFEQAVSSRLIADVPVGMYLSGGLDSNAIAAQMRSLGVADFQTFTMGYASDKEADEYDESQIAKECANYYGVKNHCIDLGVNNHFLADLEKTISMFGQPFGNATCLVAERLSSMVSDSHKVCLVGDGGDELLAGYPRHKALRIYKSLRYVPKFIFSSLLSLVNLLPENGRHATKIRRARQFLEGCRLPMASAYLQWMGYKDFEAINKALSSTGATPFYNHLADTFRVFEADPVRAASIVDFLSFVPFNLMQASDRTSMSNSLELRAPFVAKNIVLTMCGLSSKNKFSKKYNKRLLVEGLLGVLPADILSKKKKPFNPPMRGIIMSNIKFIKKYLCSNDESLLVSLVGMDFIQNEVDDFEAGVKDNSSYLYGLATLECWLRKNYKNTIPVA